jgi:hypothetical protein
MEVVDVIEELIKEVKSYRRTEAAQEKRRERIAELLRIARAENYGPADLARKTDYFYTPDHIGRIAPPPPKNDSA